MPKKKEKKGGDKQDGEKKTQKVDISSDKSGSEDKEKDLYLIQIRYLSEQLERYQLKCDDLEKQKKDLSFQHGALEKEKRDIVDYLKRSLLEKEDALEELSERLESQRQAADEDRDALQRRHDGLRLELQGRIEELTQEKETLAARLADLEEFEKQKEQLTSKLTSLETQLTSQREEHKADIHSLEMKALMEKRRLEKEMESHVAAMAAEVQRLVDLRVPETTRSALQENAEVKARLNQLSEQTRVLMRENSALQDRKSRLRADVDVLEETISELTRTSCVRKKVVEQLTEKHQQLQVELDVCRKEKQQLQTERDGVLAEAETLRQDRASLTQQRNQHKAEASRLEAELRDERRRRSRMKSAAQEAAAAARRALMQVAPSGLDQPAELDVVRWKQLLQKLLVVLEKPDQQQISDPASRPETLDPDSSFHFDLARYRPGDLGFVPPPHPGPKLKPVQSRTGPETFVPPLHRRPISQKMVNVTQSSAKFSTTKPLK